LTGREAPPPVLSHGRAPISTRCCARHARREERRRHAREHARTMRRRVPRAVRSCLRTASASCWPRGRRGRRHRGAQCARGRHACLTGHADPVWLLHSIGHATPALFVPIRTLSIAIVPINSGRDSPPSARRTRARTRDHSHVRAQKMFCHDIEQWPAAQTGILLRLRKTAGARLDFERARAYWQSPSAFMESFDFSPSGWPQRCLIRVWIWPNRPVACLGLIESVWASSLVVGFRWRRRGQPTESNAAPDRMLPTI
jgi:hypothetical protein